MSNFYKKFHYFKYSIKKKFIKKAKELVRKKKGLHEKNNQTNKISTRNAYIKKVSEETGLCECEIQKLVEQEKSKHDIKITDEAILYLMTMKLTKRKKSAPQCRGLKKDGSRCQKKIRHPSCYCHHHRSVIGVSD